MPGQEALSRRVFLRNAGTGAVALAMIAAGCRNEQPTPTDQGGGSLGADFFKAPTDALADLSKDTVSAGQSRMTVEEFTKPVADRFDPPIQISTVATTQPAVKYPPGDSLENNAWIRAYERKYGIKVSTKWAVDATQYDQRVNLMIASGDIPDFFMANQSQFDQLVRADLVEDLTEVYRKHASDRMRAVVLESGPTPLQSAIYDGRLMGIPWSSNGPEISPMWVVRKDWLDKLGLSVPKTMDDLLEVSAAFATGDPDGSGKQDTYGLAVDQLLWYLWGFFNGHHAYKELWIDKGGALAYGSVQPEMKAALQQLQSMRKAGQIDGEFGTKSGTQVYEDIVAGRLGLFQGGGSFSFGTELKKNNPKAEIVSFPLVSVDDEPARPQVDQPNVRGYWVVKKGYQNPEAVLKLIDLWIDAFYFTPSDEVYKAFQNDNELDSPVWLLNRAAVYRTYKNVDLYRSVTRLIDSGNADLATLRPEPRSVYQQVKDYMDGDVQYYDWYLGFYGPTSGRAAEDTYRQKNLYMNDQFYGQPTRTMSQRQASLLKLENETMTKIITGAPIAGFDSFVQEWKRIGGDQVTREVNDWREEQQKGQN